MNKSYREDISLLKCICALAVVGIHITSRYVLEMDIAFVFNQVFRFCVPIFIIISGMLLYYTDKIKKYTLSKFYLGRFRKIFIPYCIWTLIYMSYDLRHQSYKIFQVDFFTNFITNIFKGYGFLYFIVIIFQLYILYPLLKKLLNTYYKQTFILSLLTTFYFQLGVYLFRWNIYILPNIFKNDYFIMFPSWLFYFVFGMTLTKKRNAKPYNLNCTIFILWVISFAILLTESKVTNTYGSSIKPTIMLYSIVSYYFIHSITYKISLHKPTLKRRILGWIGQQSFIFYLLHILVINLLYSYSYIFGFNNIWYRFEGMILLYFVVCLSTCIMIYLLSYIPLVKLLGGKYYGKLKHKNLLKPINDSK